jgi:hypothetical protein
LQEAQEEPPTEKFNPESHFLLKDGIAIEISLRRLLAVAGHKATDRFCSTAA